MIIDRTQRNQYNNLSTIQYNKLKNDTTRYINRVTNQSIYSFESNIKTNKENEKSYFNLREERNPSGISLPFTFNEEILGNIPHNLSISKLKFLKKKDEKMIQEKNKNKKFFNDFHKNKHSEKFGNRLMFRQDKNVIKKNKIEKTNVHFEEENLLIYNAKKNFISGFDQEKMSLFLKLNTPINFSNVIKDSKKFTDIFDKNKKYMVEDSKNKLDKLMYI